MGHVQLAWGWGEQLRLDGADAHLHVDLDGYGPTEPQDDAHGTAAMHRKLAAGGTSPWGGVQTAEILAPGIIEVSTASHGGIWLSPLRVKTLRDGGVPANSGATRTLEWHEEDCDALQVAWFFRVGVAATTDAHAYVFRCCEQNAEWVRGARDSDTQFGLLCRASRSPERWDAIKAMRYRTEL